MLFNIDITFAVILQSIHFKMTWGTVTSKGLSTEEEHTCAIEFIALKNEYNNSALF